MRLNVNKQRPRYSRDNLSVVSIHFQEKLYKSYKNIKHKINYFLWLTLNNFSQNVAVPL